MAETLLEKDALSAAGIAPTTDYLWVQRAAGTGDADRRLALADLAEFVEGFIGLPTVDEGGLVRRNTTTGAGVTHFVYGIAADGTLMFATPPGAGDVLGPTSSVAGNVATFGDATGNVIEDSGIDSTDILLGANNLSDVASAATAKTNLALATVATTALHSDLTLDDGTNPHGTTKGDVGLGNVDNTADVNKPVSTAVQTALNLKIDASEKGVANGVATLNDSGLLPSTQLPSYVDDVLEYNNLAGFPATGETGKIYIAEDTGKTYRWSGSAYVELTDATAVWGQVSGVLANQADLVSAIATAKQEAIDDALALIIALG